MAMRFELIGKTKVKLTDVDIQSHKLGQTDLKPAVALTFEMTTANTALNMLSKRLRSFFYEKASPAKEVQGTLEGVAPVSDLTALTEEAKGLGLKRSWSFEQTGCTLAIYLGVTLITLKDCTLQGIKYELKEGGGVDWVFTLYSSTDVDGDVYAEVGVLKNHELDIELTAPELISAKQASIDDKKVAPSKGGSKKKITAAEAQQGIADAMEAADKPKGLGTDADQAARQEKVLAADPTMATSAPLEPGGEGWPFPTGANAAVAH